MGNTDSLAAKIVRAKARAIQVSGEVPNRVAQARITGLCDAWEHMTGETATEETLAEAAKRWNDQQA